ncbi:hypothetical protein V5799_027093 [Amblyomma americanum]|uniref:Uncharacterized protein n=1 Tax=Amblyomma americanum TaxID=6943 RepID=A0AAQ4DGQ1_AMBAM
MEVHYFLFIGCGQALAKRRSPPERESIAPHKSCGPPVTSAEVLHRDALLSSLIYSSKEDSTAGNFPVFGPRKARRVLPVVLSSSCCRLQYRTQNSLTPKCLLAARLPCSNAYSIAFSLKAAV